jgi:hypothetical protein
MPNKNAYRVSTRGIKIRSVRKVNMDSFNRRSIRLYRIKCKAVEAREKAQNSSAMEKSFSNEKNFLYLYTNRVVKI